MNNLILKEIYRAILFSKLSCNNPSDIHNLDDSFANIQKIIVNNNMHFIENNDLKCYMFKYNNTIFIAINLITQYEKKLTKFKDKIYINRKMFEYYQDLEDKLYQNIIEYDKTKNIKKIYVCGYKLGGSFATVIAAILAEKFKHMYLVSCFTFGALKVGNKYFREYFNKNITCNYRVLIESDIHWSNNWKHYVHISNHLQLENDNIIEIDEQHQTSCNKIVRYFFGNHEMTDNNITINTYLEKINNIISTYNININNTRNRMPTLCITPFKRDENDSTSSSLSNKSLYPPSGPSTTNKCGSPMIEELSQLIIKKIEHVDDMLMRFIERQKTSTQNENMQIKDIVLQF
jgi:hypothetical protein